MLWPKKGASLFSKHIYVLYVWKENILHPQKHESYTQMIFSFSEKWDIHGSALWKRIKPNKNTMWKIFKHVFFGEGGGGTYNGLGWNNFWESCISSTYTNSLVNATFALGKKNVLSEYNMNQRVVVNTVWSFNNGGARDPSWA